METHKHTPQNDTSKAIKKKEESLTYKLLSIHNLLASKFKTHFFSYVG